MNTIAAAAERVTLERLLWASACVALALLADVSTLPPWVLAAVGCAAAVRLVLAARGRGAPPRAIRWLVSAASIGWLFLQLRTFNGLSAGTALLSLIAGLKLMETQTRRDLHVITLIIYFLSLAALLAAESFWLLSYLIGVCWLTTSTLLFSNAPRAGRGGTAVRYTGRILAQALPLAVAAWLFFPRFGGPLWQMADDGRSATSGLSDTMSPGDITDLAASDEVAFRVRFSAAAPPPQERYWRGPVLHDFDGHAWRRTDAGPVRAPALLFQGPEYRYTVSLEPNRHNWIFVLDWPARWNAPRGVLTSDYMLVAPNPIVQPTDVVASSYGHVLAGEPLSAGMRRRDTWLPPGRNARTMRLARELRDAHPDDMGYVRAVLDMFRRQPFFYTLTPPPLADDSVDEFLFDSRRGFCGHYASAFAVLMRAIGIPARVVTGYQGGTFNRFADYWILRQSDAHAWDEIWIEGRGWLRVDPTSAIAAERVERGLNDIVSAGQPLTSRWQQRTPWLTDTRLRIDALRLLWRERILRYDQGSQEKLLSFLHIPEPDPGKLALVLAVGLILGMMWLTWQVPRALQPSRRDPVDRAYARVCRALAAVGLPRTPHEGAEAYASRVAARRPDLASALTALCRRYSDLKYAGKPSRAAASTFVAGARAFRPRGSRASS